MQQPSDDGRRRSTHVRSSMNLTFGAGAHSPTDAFERGMIDFVRRWEPYGGGSASDIYESFGMRESAFFARALALLDTDYVASHFDSTVTHRIRDVCLLRLMS
ncbi:hypothetical protein ACP6C7_14445 [Mycolicibacterium septicum]|uniref:DUF3263 domain-containing protein n=2 Tax=Mycolicibacterium septicum TaxID=98668 RepID=A0A7X6MZE8_9MYCO|nr:MULTISPECIES: hypothetical protein [Mycolicibacterium]MBX8689324.1 hypothetical protein [Mycobacterium sp. 20091114027_K0903767]MCP3811074.1 hypothetical protein [Mycobacteriaceae bacterium Msp059]NKZ15719.1 hypothetical protein [Mycolicibacterium septicum DSM 44393]